MESSLGMMAPIVINAWPKHRTIGALVKLSPPVVKHRPIIVILRCPRLFARASKDDRPQLASSNGPSPFEARPAEKPGSRLRVTDMGSLLAAVGVMPA
jgi:hypothetical protein